MERYTNIGGDSGVYAYEIGIDYIEIEFDGTQRTYTYSYRKSGRIHVEQMKVLAKSGSGLNSYINKYFKFLYD